MAIIYEYVCSIWSEKSYFCCMLVISDFRLRCSEIQENDIANDEVASYSLSDVRQDSDNAPSTPITGGISDN